MIPLDQSHICIGWQRKKLFIVSGLKDSSETIRQGAIGLREGCPGGI